MSCFSEGAQEAKRQRSECDDPREAVGPAVLSESAALSQAETKQKVSRHGVESLREPWRSASRRDGRSRGGRRTARAAEGKACRQFLAPFGDWDVPKGFAKNGDTIVGIFCASGIEYSIDIVYQPCPGISPTEPGLIRLHVTTTSSRWHWYFPRLLSPVHSSQTNLPLFFPSETCQP